MSAEILSIRKVSGIAGQTEIRATVRYPDEEASTVSFVGSEAYGGPVVMVSETGTQVFVTDPSRFGSFGTEWVRRFFGEES
jgi:hypothetical protein